MSKSNRIEHKDGVIYMFRNKINGKCYVGQTVNERERYLAHKNPNRNDSVFHRAINKYGFDNFEYKVLFRIHCNNEQDLKNTLNIKEIISIKYFKSFIEENGYNVTKGGEGSLGIIISEEEKKKRSIRVSGEKHPMYGKHHTLEARRKISEAGRRRIITKKTREKLSNSLKNLHRKLTPEQKEHLRKVNKGRKLTQDQYNKMIKAVEAKGLPVIQFSLEGKFIKEWKCVGEAIRSLTNLNKSSIKTCCRHVRLGKTNVSACGFMWRYKEDWDGKDIPGFKSPKYEVKIYNKDTKELVKQFDSMLSAANFIGVHNSTLTDRYLKSKDGEFEYRNYFWKITKL